MRSIIISSFILCFFIFSQRGMSGEKDIFPTSKKIGNKELTLNGVGIRKATFLKVKVYIGALYLEKKASNSDEFLNNDSVKYIEMHFVRDVGKKDMVDGWLEAFNNSLSKKIEPYKEQIDKFLSTAEEMKDKDIMTLTFSSQGVKTSIKGLEKEFIPGKDFAKALLSIWFINAKDEGLRDGLLGSR